ncbi:MAG: hypothetical protein JWR15_2178 [Prosthecobacter sp.]|nr:hypothetical protein [Prosthecobacter sp.]
MKLFIRILLVSAAVCLSLSGCVLTLLMLGDDNITKDARFAQVMGREIPAKKALYLSKPDNGRPDDMRPLYDVSDTSPGPRGLAAVVPAGTRVRFHRGVRKNGMGDSAEYLIGGLTLKGRTYPIDYYLGCSVYPDGWRRMYDAFVIKE